MSIEEEVDKAVKEAQDFATLHGLRPRMNIAHVMGRMGRKKPFRDDEWQEVQAILKAKYR